MQMNKLIIYVTCDASECCACSICMFLPSWKRDNFSEQIQDKIWIDLCTCRQVCSWYEILVWCNANYPRNKKHNKDLLNPRIFLLCLTILEESTATRGKLSGQPQPILWQVPHQPAPYMLFVLVLLPYQFCSYSMLRGFLPPAGQVPPPGVAAMSTVIAFVWVSVASSCKWSWSWLSSRCWSLTHLTIEIIMLARIPNVRMQFGKQQEKIFCPIFLFFFGVACNWHRML